MGKSSLFGRSYGLYQGDGYFVYAITLRASPGAGWKIVPQRCPENAPSVGNGCICIPRQGIMTRFHVSKIFRLVGPEKAIKSRLQGLFQCKNSVITWFCRHENLMFPFCLRPEARKGLFLFGYFCPLVVEGFQLVSLFLPVGKQGQKGARNARPRVSAVPAGKQGRNLWHTPLPPPLGDGGEGLQCTHPAFWGSR